MNDQATSEVATSGSKRTAPPPIERIPVLRWARENLVSTPFNTVVTAVCLIGLIYFLPDFIQWALFDAVFVTSDHKVCRAAEGACWAVIGEKHRPMFFVYILMKSIGASSLRYLFIFPPLL